MAELRQSAPQPIVVEACVLTSMALTTLALGTALYLHAGFAFSGALMSALAAYALMLVGHGLLRRLATQPTRTIGPKASSSGALTAERVAEALAALPEENVKPPVSALHDVPGDGPVAVQVLDEKTSDGQPVVAVGGPPMIKRDVVAPPPVTPGGVEAGAGAPSAPLRDLPPARFAPGPQRDVPPPTPPRPADVELIQALIKKLADEVNAEQPVEMVSSEAAALPASIAHAGPDADDIPEMDDARVDALRTAADSMRQLDERAMTGEGTAEDAPTHLAPPALPDASDGTPHPALSVITDAVNSGRINVLLDPIVGLGAEAPRAQHFEIGLQLRDVDDTVLDIADGLEGLRGTGVYPLIDQAQIDRTSQLAQRLQARGKAGHLFTQTRGESLIADPFLDAFADTYRAREAFASQLVMTFTQADVRAFGPREWATLADMAELGFQFAIASVSDLDMDFGDLAVRRFMYLKLDAEVFLNGLAAGETFVPAADICRHVETLGMTVIVGQIETDEVKEQVAGLGVLLGQGDLFGGARMVRAEAVAPREGQDGAEAAA